MLVEKTEFACEMLEKAVQYPDSQRYLGGKWKTCDSGFRIIVLGAEKLMCRLWRDKNTKMCTKDMRQNYRHCGETKHSY